mmetsp:Transcript_15692/g.32477  ORF Transcript_15692/g.32477 Transcript_15692/m.32477 type:complete len:201 (-) Transcript_15692:669-1271(-)
MRHVCQTCFPSNRLDRVHVRPTGFLRANPKTVNKAIHVRALMRLAVTKLWGHNQDISVLRQVVDTPCLRRVDWTDWNHSDLTRLGLDTHPRHSTVMLAQTTPSSYSQRDRNLLLDMMCRSISSARDSTCQTVDTVVPTCPRCVATKLAPRIQTTARGHRHWTFRSTKKNSAHRAFLAFHNKRQPDLDEIDNTARHISGAQ